MVTCCSRGRYIGEVSYNLTFIPPHAGTSARCRASRLCLSSATATSSRTRRTRRLPHMAAGPAGGAPASRGVIRCSSSAGRGGRLPASGRLGAARRGHGRRGQLARRVGHAGAGGADQAVALHRDQGAARVGHLLHRAVRPPPPAARLLSARRPRERPHPPRAAQLRHAAQLHAARARALGHRRTRARAHAQLPPRVALLPAPVPPACSC